MKQIEVGTILIINNNNYLIHEDLDRYGIINHTRMFNGDGEQESYSGKTIQEAVDKLISLKGKPEKILSSDQYDMSLRIVSKDKKSGIFYMSARK